MGRLLPRTFFSCLIAVACVAVAHAAAAFPAPALQPLHTIELGTSAAQSPDLAPGVKAPQAAKAQVPVPKPATSSEPGVKPPQSKAKALAAKPAVKAKVQPKAAPAKAKPAAKAAAKPA